MRGEASWSDRRLGAILCLGGLAIHAGKVQTYSPTTMRARQLRKRTKPFLKMISIGDSRAAFDALLALTGGVASTERFERLLHPLHSLLHATRVMLVGFAHVLDEHAALKELAAREGSLLRAANFNGEFDLWIAKLDRLRALHGGKVVAENPANALRRYYGMDVCGGGKTGQRRRKPRGGRGKRKSKNR